ncbi:MAG: hypothetical protein RBG13Loki_2486 [Promethearchaeota archaeon CR_4]|nr:MAG: hypothetical protein RBG13Loki_2486 [Candidatus Lokiarchaeota archaeon CR_4]
MRFYPRDVFYLPRWYLDMPKAEKLQVGDRAPDFTLPTLSGSSISLSQVLQGGKRVVLALFRSYY